MGNVTEVVSFELDTARDDFAVDVTIRLRRHPEGIKYFGNEPTSEDLPIDFALALVKWLAMGDRDRVVVGSDHNDAK